VQAGFDGAERDVHGGGDLSQAEPVHEAEQQDLTLLFGSAARTICRSEASAPAAAGAGVCSSCSSSAGVAW